MKSTNRFINSEVDDKAVITTPIRDGIKIAMMKFLILSFVEKIGKFLEFLLAR